MTYCSQERLGGFEEHIRRGSQPEQFQRVLRSDGEPRGASVSPEPEAARNAAGRAAEPEAARDRADAAAEAPSFQAAIATGSSSMPEPLAGSRKVRMKGLWV